MPSCSKGPQSISHSPRSRGKYSIVCLINQVSINISNFSLDVLATVLEEMPPFPEKESSGLLNLLKRKRPGRVPDNPGLESSGDGEKKKENGTSGLSLASHQAQEGGSVDLLGLGNGPSVTANGGGGGTVDNIKKFYIKNNGVLYENDVVQVDLSR